MEKDCDASVVINSILELNRGGKNTRTSKKNDLDTKKQVFNVPNSERINYVVNHYGLIKDKFENRTIYKRKLLPSKESITNVNILKADLYYHNNIGKRNLIITTNPEDYRFIKNELLAENLTRSVNVCYTGILTNRLMKLCSEDHAYDKFEGLNNILLTLLTHDNIIINSGNELDLAVIIQICQCFGIHCSFYRSTIAENDSSDLVITKKIKITKIPDNIKSVYERYKLNDIHAENLPKGKEEEELWERLNVNTLFFRDKAFKNIQTGLTPFEENIIVYLLKENITSFTFKEFLAKNRQTFPISEADLPLFKTFVENFSAYPFRIFTSGYGDACHCESRVEVDLTLLKLITFEGVMANNNFLTATIISKYTPGEYIAFDIKELLELCADKNNAGTAIQKLLTGKVYDDEKYNIKIVSNKTSRYYEVESKLATRDGFVPLKEFSKLDVAMILNQNDLCYTEKNGVYKIVISEFDDRKAIEIASDKVIKKLTSKKLKEEEYFFKNVKDDKSPNYKISAIPKTDINSLHEHLVKEAQNFYSVSHLYCRKFFKILFYIVYLLDLCKKKDYEKAKGIFNGFLEVCKNQRSSNGFPLLQLYCKDFLIYKDIDEIYGNDNVISDIENSIHNYSKLQSYLKTLPETIKDYTSVPNLLSKTFYIEFMGKINLYINKH